MSSRREFLRAVTATAITAAASDGLALGQTASRRSPQAPPNIIFFVPDQTPAHELSAFGGQNIATPNMDSVAERLTFTNGLSTSSVCAPYRA